MSVAPSSSSWDRLSQSSREALRWAAAMARGRRDRGLVTGDEVVVDEHDLLVGLMLAHPADSEPRILLAHVGASAADVLPHGYPTPEPDLAARALAVSADSGPRLSQVTESILRESQSLAGADGVAPLRSVFGAMLLTTNDVSTAFRRLLADRGVPGAVDGYRDYLADPAAHANYGEFLRLRFPFTARPVEIPDYKADDPRVGDDLVDIRVEVDAFAYLLASRSLRPPLAVGLFGGWGSGKTFFMESVRRRIASLARADAVRDTPQRDLPFWKNIVQIRFNAWHYVEGDLWASLVEHVFAELRVEGDDESAVARRTREVIGELEDKRAAGAEVTAALAVKERERADAESDLRDAERHRAEEEAALESARATAVADLPLIQSKSDARKALAGFAERASDGSAGEALSAIADFRAQLRRGAGALVAYPASRRERCVALAALVAVPLLIFALAQVEAIPGTAQVFAGISLALGLLAKGLRSVTGWARVKLDALAEAEARINEDVRIQKEQLDLELMAKARTVSDARAEVARLTAERDAIEHEVARLEEKRRTITSVKVLDEFVAERKGSTDYRRLLGTAALVQRDFSELSSMIEDQNAHFVRDDEGGLPPEGEPATMNRIILYIDDLDRCEPAQVIRVLQAVHLLLAFELFVVVVAVDSRWLAQALEQHYPGLGTSSAGADPARLDPTDHATPSDYLEKIFQVPFWIDPLGPSGRTSLVRGLLQGNLVRSGGGDDDGGAEPLEFSDAAAEMVVSMFDRSPAVRLETATMGVTASELGYLDDLAVLLGDTPRAVKRFVNVYQLLCAMPPPPATSVAYEDAVGLLLALTDGLPALSGALDEHLPAAAIGPVEPLSALIARVRPLVPHDQMARFDEWAADHGAILAIASGDFAETARRVRRFSFR